MNIIKSKKFQYSLLTILLFLLGITIAAFFYKAQMGATIGFFGIFPLNALISLDEKEIKESQQKNNKIK